jgi:hypothetical protein
MIAENCRTSVEMIEKYYASHIKNMLDAAAINVRRPQPVKKEVEAARRGELTWEKMKIYFGNSQYFTWSRSGMNLSVVNRLSGGRCSPSFVDIIR